MSRALLKQALDALSFVTPCAAYSSTRELMRKIKEELTNPETEPVAYRQYIEGSDESNLGWFDYLDSDESHDGYDPLYASPPQQKPLDKIKINLIAFECYSGSHNEFDVQMFARAIEKAHDIL